MLPDDSIVWTVCLVGDVYVFYIFYQRCKFFMATADLSVHGDDCGLDFGRALDGRSFDNFDSWRILVDRYSERYQLCSFQTSLPQRFFILLARGESVD